MKTATVKELKTELGEITKLELLNLCLELAKFKKENKELLTYLLFESENEQRFISQIKNEMEEQFQSINTSSYFYIKKSTRKILRRIKTYIRYSKNKETEVELLLFFCEQMMEVHPTIKNNIALHNIFKREVLNIEKKILKLHEDLQFDYTTELSNLK